MRKPEIDTIKGLAIIGVIFAHMSFKSRFDIITLEYISNLQIIFGWCVIAFFFASGLLVKPISTKKDFIVFTKNKFQRLVIPCIIFSITYRLLLMGISSTSLFPKQSNFLQILFTIFTPISPQFYFLPYLFVISVFTALLELYISRKIIFLSTAIIISFIYFLVSTPNHPYGQALNLIPLYFYSYIIGLFLSKEDSSLKFNRHCFFNSITFFVSMILLSLNIEIKILIQVFIPIVLWIVLIKFPSFSNYLNRTRLGENSSSIYVWHAPLVLPFLSIICVKIIGGGKLVIIPILLLTIIISIALGKITAKYHFLRFWRF